MTTGAPPHCWHNRSPSDPPHAHVPARITSYNVCYTKLLRIAWLFNIIERGSASYGRIERLLAEQSPIRSPDDAEALRSPTPLSVTLRRHASPEGQAVLQDLQLV